MGSRRKLGLAGRAGRWSAGHRKTAIWGWIAFVIAAIALGGALGTKTLDNGGGDGESARAEKTLEGGFPQSASEAVIVQAEGNESIHGKDARAAVGAVESRLRKLPFVHDLTGNGATGRTRLQCEIPGLFGLRRTCPSIRGEIIGFPERYQESDAEWQVLQLKVTFGIGKSPLLHRKFAFNCQP